MPFYLFMSIESSFWEVETWKTLFEVELKEQPVAKVLETPYRILA